MGGRSEEERRFTVLLEEVQRQYTLLSERVTGLDQRVGQELGDLRQEMKTGFEDMRVGIRMLVKEVQGHHHAN